MTRATWNGVELARSDDTVIVDGYTYFPRADVRIELLEPSDRTSVCGWKGTASYHDVVVDGAELENAAFEYRTPKPAAAHVEGRIAFWRGVRIEEDAPGPDRPIERPRPEDGLLARLGRRLVGAPARSTSAAPLVPVDGAVAELTDAGFTDAVHGAWTIVDFSAPWCGPCRAFEPLFEQAARRAPEGTRFARCDVDANPVTAALFDILTVPTVVLLGPDGAEVDRIAGVPTHGQLAALVARAGRHVGV